MATIRKRGPPRKSRKRRIAIGDGHGPFDWEPSAQDWTAIERAYGCALGEADRAQLVKHMSEYLLYVPAESHAPFANDVDDVLLKIGKGAEAFKEILWDWPPTASPKWMATSIGRDHIDIALANMPEPRPKDITALAHMLVHFVVACEAARQMHEIDVASGGFVEGQEWQALIRGLTGFAKERGMRTGASKDSDKRNAPSPFVNFVMALMASVPQEARRHCSTWQACAQAISEARRKT